MIDVFIVDDHYLVIEGIRSLLQQAQDIACIGHATTADSCRAFMKSNKPDLILLDINLPDGSGIDLCKELRQQYPAVHILAISTFNQDSYVQKMMDNGASGYVLKNVSSRELIEAIHTVMKGGQHLSHEVARNLRTAREQEVQKISLGRREHEVLTLIAQGLTNPEIAESLGLSVHTVDTYRKSLLNKLNARNSADLVRIGYEEGLLG